MSQFIDASVEWWDERKERIDEHERALQRGREREKVPREKGKYAGSRNKSDAKTSANGSSTQNSNNRESTLNKLIPQSYSMQKGSNRTDLDAHLDMQLQHLQTITKKQKDLQWSESRSKRKKSEEKQRRKRKKGSSTDQTDTSENDRRKNDPFSRSSSSPYDHDDRQRRKKRKDVISSSSSTSSGDRGKHRKKGRSYQEGKHGTSPEERRNRKEHYNNLKVKLNSNTTSTSRKGPYWGVSPQKERWSRGEKHGHDLEEILGRAQFAPSKRKQSIQDLFLKEQPDLKDMTEDEKHVMQELVEEIWSLEAALRSCENRITQMLNDEERLGALHEIDAHMETVKSANKKLEQESIDLQTRMAAVIEDLKKAEGQGQEFLEIIQKGEDNNREYEEKITALKAKCQNMEAEHERQRKDILAKHQVQIQELEMRHAKSCREYEDQMLALHSGVSKSEANSQLAITKLNAEHANEIQELRRESQQERVRLIGEYKGEMKSVTEECDRRITCLRSEYSKMKADAETAFLQELGNLRQTHTERISRMSEDFKAEKDGIFSDFALSRKKLEGQIKEFEEIARTSQQQSLSQVSLENDEINKLKLEIENTKRDYEEKMEKQKLDFQKEIAEYEIEYQNQVDSFRREKDRLMLAAETSRRETSEMHKQDRLNQSVEHRAMVQDMHERHSSMSETMDKHIQHLEKELSKARALLDKTDETKATILRESEEKIARIRNKKNQELEEVKTSLRQARNLQDTQVDVRAKELSADKIKALETKIQAHEDSIVQLQAIIATKGLQIRDLNEDVEKYKEEHERVYSELMGAKANLAAQEQIATHATDILKRRIAELELELADRKESEKFAKELTDLHNIAHQQAVDAQQIKRALARKEEEEAEESARLDASVQQSVSLGQEGSVRQSASVRKSVSKKAGSAPSSAIDGGDSIPESSQSQRKSRVSRKSVTPKSGVAASGVFKDVAPPEGLKRKSVAKNTVSRSSTRAKAVNMQASVAFDDGGENAPLLFPERMTASHPLSLEEFARGRESAALQQDVEEKSRESMGVAMQQSRELFSFNEFDVAVQDVNEGIDGSQSMTLNSGLGLQQMQSQQAAVSPLVGPSAASQAPTDGFETTISRPPAVETNAPDTTLDRLLKKDSYAMELVTKSAKPASKLRPKKKFKASSTVPNDIDQLEGSVQEVKVVPRATKSVLAAGSVDVAKLESLKKEMKSSKKKSIVIRSGTAENVAAEVAAADAVPVNTVQAQYAQLNTQLPQVNGAEARMAEAQIAKNAVRNIEMTAVNQANSPQISHINRSGPRESFPLSKAGEAVTAPKRKAQSMKVPSPVDGVVEAKPKAKKKSNLSSPQMDAPDANDASATNEPLDTQAANAAADRQLDLVDSQRSATLFFHDANETSVPIVGPPESKNTVITTLEHSQKTSLGHSQLLGYHQTFGIGQNINRSKANNSNNTSNASHLLLPFLPSKNHDMEVWRSGVQELEDQLLALTDKEWFEDEYYKQALHEMWRSCRSMLVEYTGKLTSLLATKIEKLRVDVEDVLIPEIQQKYESYFSDRVMATQDATIALSEFSDLAKHFSTTHIDIPSARKVIDSIKNREVLDLWRDCLLLQPAVEDLGHEILDHIEMHFPEDDPRKRRCLSISKSLTRGMEKYCLKYENQIAEDSANTVSGIPFSDVARACLVLASFEDFSEVLNWLQQEPSVKVVSLKNRFISPTNLMWRDVILRLYFAEKADVIWELQLIHYQMVHCDVRNTTSFDEIRFFKELMFQVRN